MLSIYIISLIGSVAFPYLVGAQCTSVCQGFASGLDNCKNLYDAAVSSDKLPNHVSSTPLSSPNAKAACRWKATEPSAVRVLRALVVR